MPLVLPGAIILGPRASSAPSNIRQYLASIGKDSWLANWLATSGLAPNSDGSGGAVADGGAWGCWSTFENVASNWKFIQPTSAKRPAYTAGGASFDGLPAVYGNAASWTAYLDSATALNKDYTLLISTEMKNVTGGVISQNLSYGISVYGVANAEPTYHYEGTAAGGNPLPKAVSSTPAGATWLNIRRIAISSGTGTTRYGYAPHLFSWAGSSAWSNALIRQIVFCPKLTASECAQAIQYLV